MLRFRVVIFFFGNGSYRAEQTTCLAGGYDYKPFPILPSIEMIEKFIVAMGMLQSRLA